MTCFSICMLCLLTNTLLIAKLHYAALDRLLTPQRYYDKYVATKVVSRQPNNMSTSCCYVATSERRRIRLKADFHYFALRGASIRRSQRGNNSATPHTFHYLCGYTPLTTFLSCVVTARRTAVGQYLVVKRNTTFPYIFTHTIP